MEEIINLQSYTAKFPTENCKIKVALKVDNFDKNESVKTTVYEDAIYDSGFITIPGGTFLATNFLFHKLKRKNI